MVNSFAIVPSPSQVSTTIHRGMPQLSMNLLSARPAIHVVAQAAGKSLPVISGQGAILGKIMTFFKSRSIASFAVATLLITSFTVLLQRILWKPSRTYNQEGENTPT